MEEKKLPESEVYEKGLRYWPYKSSQDFVLDRIAEFAPSEGQILDIMCGPGNLLGRIAKILPNFKLIGVDKDPRYIEYGQKTYPKISFREGDILSWKSSSPIDIVICTGAIHHIPYEDQEKAIVNIASIIKENQGRIAIISDCYIDNYTNEIERKIAAAKLGYEYINRTIISGAPDDVISWTINIMWNDVFEKEFKTSLAKRIPILEKYFRIVCTSKTWPDEETEYGDYVHICYI